MSKTRVLQEEVPWVLAQKRYRCSGTSRPAQIDKLSGYRPFAQRYSRSLASIRGCLSSSLRPFAVVFAHLFGLRVRSRFFSVFAICY
jgi:hypothetical protein